MPARSTRPGRSCWEVSGLQNAFGLVMLLGKYLLPNRCAVWNRRAWCPPSHHPQPFGYGVATSASAKPEREALPSWTPSTHTHAGWYPPQNQEPHTLSHPQRRTSPFPPTRALSPVWRGKAGSLCEVSAAAQPAWHGAGAGSGCRAAAHANASLAPWCQQLQLICWQSAVCCENVSIGFF